MLYFFLLLLLECGLSTFLVFVILRSARRSLAGKVRHAVFYLLPVFSAILMIVFTLFFTIPGILDTERILMGDLSSRQVTVERISRWNTVIIDGRRMSHAPWGLVPAEGGVYMMTIAPRSRIIISIEPAGSAEK